jgi:cytochrome P450
MSPEFLLSMRQGLGSPNAQDHARVRRVVSPLLTPRAVERYRPAIQQIVDEALDTAPPGDTLDAVRDFAEHIPVRVIGHIFGIERERYPTFQRLSDGVLQQIVPALLPSEQREQVFQDIREGLDMVGEVIEERRRRPTEGDMLSALLHAEAQGDRLTKEELKSLVTSLLVGGSETTVHLIGFVTRHLLDRPELVGQIEREPELLKGVVEEVLRFDNFGKAGIVRYATEDVELGGVLIKKGQMVMPLLGAALRDPAAYPDADRLDPRREGGMNLAFGHGAHFCIGASLARLESQVAVGTLLRRFPAMQLAAPPVFVSHPVLRKLSTLKIRLRPAAAS